MSFSSITCISAVQPIVPFRASVDSAFRVLSVRLSEIFNLVICIYLLHRLGILFLKIELENENFAISVQIIPRNFYFPKSQNHLLNQNLREGHHKLFTAVVHYLLPLFYSQSATK